ncbi:AMP-dependent synthetase [Aquibium carbonis]|uniref:AMP-dependent synthetase n=1 Tax=Aquibium carbonis TaxID=2495581 RepID=A0A3R9Y6Q5_9HYPH|nr:AMP-binding protein [Aquibium carbonis]RST84433.1 AMP-dependent synthetase [Aquibium carbonis]
MREAKAPLHCPFLPPVSDGTGDKTALLSPGRQACSHRRLASSVALVATRLAAAGLKPGDAVALLMPNGPEMAILFLAVSTVATAAPLNPGYREAELAFYLDDLGAKLLICPKAGFEAAKSVARARGMMVAEVDLAIDGGCDELHVDLPDGLPGEAGPCSLNQASDIVLLLHTSGTTARPKLVGLTRANIEASIRNIVGTLGLGHDDVGLSILPLFHIHGLIATLCAPLSAGGAVVCTAGFDAMKVFRWIGEFSPSWYSAVPSMHQAILQRAKRNPGILGKARLRFVRSSSAALAPATLEGLERTFGCPVVEAYGMTEAAHQITSNGLAHRQPGSVGHATGTQVRIVDDAWRDVPAGTVGAIVIKGENVHTGYLKAPNANATAFRNGWFDTGDQGHLDVHGRLTITGRTKEIINRGGEKIAPLEIDAVLARDDRIAEAIAFGIPHKTLGEDVAVAIVRAEGQLLKADDIRGALAKVLAPHKVPRTVVFLEAIPKGPTGKIQRLRLAQMLGLAGEAATPAASGAGDGAAMANSP